MAGNGTDASVSRTAANTYPLPRLQKEGNWLVFVDQRETGVANPAWDMLWQKQSPGHLAVACMTSRERVERLKSTFRINLGKEPSTGQPRSEAWREFLTENLYFNAAQMSLPGDYCPALDVPGFAHGESQGMCDLFGAKVELLPDGHHYVHPLPPVPQVIDELVSAPVASSQYWQAVEYIRYARTATRSTLPFHNPVMTGPLDTANYLLGTTTLLEWLYTEPETVHKLLEKITNVMIDFITAIRQATEGTLCSHHLRCVRGGFDVCSEMRSMISTQMYEQYEAPCLRRIGNTLGPFSAHSCGNWEGTIDSMLRDQNFRAMNGQIRENELASLCRLTAGRLTLSIGRSVDVHKRFLWPDRTTYYRHILETVPEGQPFELTLEAEEDIAQWSELHWQIRGEEYPWTAPTSSMT